MTQPIPPSWPDDELPPDEMKRLNDTLDELARKHRIGVPR